MTAARRPPEYPPMFATVTRPSSARILARFPLPLLLGLPFVLGLLTGAGAVISWPASNPLAAVLGRPANRVLPDIPADPSLPDLRAVVRDHFTRYRPDPDGIEFLEWAGPVRMTGSGVVDRLTAEPRGPFSVKLEMLTRSRNVLLGEHLSRDMVYFRGNEIAWISPTGPGHSMDSKR